MHRRDFVKVSLAAAAAQHLVPAAPAAKTIGIQVGAVSFADEGAERVLDSVQQRASINTLFVATFTIGLGIARAHAPAQPPPRHSKPASHPGFPHGSTT